VDEGDKLGNGAGAFGNSICDGMAKHMVSLFQRRKLVLKRSQIKWPVIFKVWLLRELFKYLSILYLIMIKFESVTLFKLGINFNFNFILP